MRESQLVPQLSNVLLYRRCWLVDTSGARRIRNRRLACCAQCCWQRCAVALCQGGCQSCMPKIEARDCCVARVNTNSRPFDVTCQNARLLLLAMFFEDFARTSKLQCSLLGPTVVDARLVTSSLKLQQHMQAPLQLLHRLQTVAPLQKTAWFKKGGGARPVFYPSRYDSFGCGMRESLVFHF